MGSSGEYYRALVGDVAGGVGIVVGISTYAADDSS